MIISTSRENVQTPTTRPGVLGRGWVAGFAELAAVTIALAL